VVTELVEVSAALSAMVSLPNHLSKCEVEVRSRSAHFSNLHSLTCTEPVEVSEFDIPKTCPKPVHNEYFTMPPIGFIPRKRSFKFRIFGSFYRLLNEIPRILIVPIAGVRQVLFLHCT